MGEVTRTKAAWVAVLLAGLALWPSTTVFAGALNPPPPPSARCTSNAQNTTCFFSFTLVQTGVDAGVDCGSFQVVENALVFVDVRREYNRDGNLESATRHLRQPVSGSDNIWYNPLNLKSVPQVGDWNVDSTSRSRATYRLRSKRIPVPSAECCWRAVQLS